MEAFIFSFFSREAVRFKSLAAKYPIEWIESQSSFHQIVYRAYFFLLFIFREAEVHRENKHTHTIRTLEGERNCI